MRSFFLFFLLFPLLNLSFAEEQQQPMFSSPEEILNYSKTVNIEFKEGVHYQVLQNTVKTENKEVREYFSFFCGHCHAFYPVITQISHALSDDVHFIQNPVHYLGGPMGVEFQKSFAAASSLRIADEFYQYVDNSIFVENKIPQNHQDVADIFNKIGVPVETFERQYKSFPVQNMANQYKQSTEDAIIKGVPAVVVNNKYLVIQKELKNEGEYLALLNYLLQK